MAYMPKSLSVTLISPFFLMAVGCSNLPNNSFKKPEGLPVSDYHQDKNWLAAQAVKDQKFKEIKILEEWSERAVQSTARLSANNESPKIRKQRLSECPVVKEVIKRKRYYQSFEAYFQANEVQRSIYLPDNDGGIGSVDMMVENISNNLKQALRSCYAGGFNGRSIK